MINLCFFISHPSLDSITRFKALTVSSCTWRATSTIESLTEAVTHPKAWGLPWGICLDILREKQGPSSAHAHFIWDLKHPADRIALKAKKHSLCVTANTAARLCRETCSLEGSPAGPAHPGRRNSHTKQIGCTDPWPKREEITPPSVSPGRGGTQWNTALVDKKPLRFIPRIYSETLQVCFSYPACFSWKSNPPFLVHGTRGKDDDGEPVACLKTIETKYNIKGENCFCKSAKCSNAFAFPAQVPLQRAWRMGGALLQFPHLSET